MQTRTLTMTSLLALIRLVRLPLAAMVALTALAGALAEGAPIPGLALWSLSWGVFLLAAASSVLNQVQERTSDALMRRTCQRPLACGDLSPGCGTWLGLLLASGGLAVLALGNGPATALLGLAALAWYLLVYTPLKRATAFAVMAGTPCGALPPLMGWLAAGGDPFAPQALALALILFLWQVPHYWLLALPDRQELRAAGFKVLPAGLSDRQLLAVGHRWILGLALASLLLPGLDIVTRPLLQGVIIGLALALALLASLALHRSLFVLTTARRLRNGLHLYLALVFGTLLLDGLLNRLAL